MSTRIPSFDPSISSPAPEGAAEPSQLPELFARAFNAGDMTAVDRLFEPGAVRVLHPGEIVVGGGRQAATARFMALAVPIAITARHTYVNDDIALIIGDFRIIGTTVGGERIHQEGTATDVARRGPDGRWRYAIDNPTGVERH